MAAYLIAEIKVTDESWLPEYTSRVHEIVEKHGGRYLARSGNIVTLEGKQRDLTAIAILEFPSREALEGFVTDPDYAPYAQARQAGSESRFVMIDDTDIAGQIPYLEAG